MCLRTGEDTPATILLPPRILSSSRSFFLSRRPSLLVPFLSPALASLQPLVSSLCAPFAHLSNLLPSASPAPSHQEAAMLSYNLDDAGCVCVRLRLRDRCKDLELIQPAPHVGTPQGEKRSAVQDKQQINEYLAMQSSNAS